MGRVSTTFLDQITAGGPGGDSAESVGDLADLARSFERSMRAEGRQPKGIGTYMEGVGQFIAFSAANGLPTDAATVRREHVEHWLVSLRDAGRSPATVRNRYGALKRFFAYLQDEGEVTESPMRNVPRPTLAEQPVDMPTLDDVRAVLATCGSKSFEDVRDGAVIRLFLDTGLRRGELLGLTVEAVNLDSQRASVLGKGGRQRVVPFGPKAAHALDRYQRMRRKHRNATLPNYWLGARGKAFNESGLATMLRRRSERAGVRHINPHGFRHLFAHLWQSDGRNEGALMEIAGWRSREMLGRYAKSASVERALAEYDRAPSPSDRL